MPYLAALAAENPGMNIAFASNANPYGRKSFGGAEASMRLLAEKLAERGHKVVYVARDVGAADRVAAADVNVQLHELRGSRSRVGRLVSALDLARLFRRQEIDIFYCFYELDVLRSVVLARMASRRPLLVMQAAGLHWYEVCLRDRTRIPLYRRLFGKLDAVNFVDEQLVAVTRTKLEELGMGTPWRRSFVVEIGSGVGSERVRAHQDQPAEPFRLVMAARFASYSRRHDILVRAMALIPPSRRVELTLVGEGTRRSEIEKIATEEGLAGRVQFVPFLPQAELWELLSRHHLLTHCAEHEGLGKAIVESMSLGLPVLASNVPVINGYIEDGRNGFLCENEPSAWADRICALMDDRDARERVADAGREFARRQHSPEANVVRYEREFEALLQNG